MGGGPVPKSKRWYAILRQKGFRLTEPRKAVVEYILTQEEPFTAEGILAGLHDLGIGRATVFRTIKLLYEMGFLMRLHLEEGCQHYSVASEELSADEHSDCIVCKVCGQVTVLAECPLKQETAEIAKRQGYRIVGHHISLYGICAGCSVGTSGA